MLENELPRRLCTDHHLQLALPVDSSKEAAARLSATACSSAAVRFYPTRPGSTSTTVILFTTYPDYCTQTGKCPGPTPYALRLAQSYLIPRPPHTQGGVIEVVITIVILVSVPYHRRLSGPIFETCSIPFRDIDACLDWKVSNGIPAPSTLI